MLRPLARAGKTAVIPPKANRKEARAYDKDLYKVRHLIENFFAKLKQYRAIATRYDKRAVHFLGAIHLAAAVVWLNCLGVVRHRAAPSRRVGADEPVNPDRSRGSRSHAHDF